MKKISVLILISTALLSACVGKVEYNEQKLDSVPYCEQETTVVIYENGEQFIVPACADYVEQPLYTMYQSETQFVDNNHNIALEKAEREKAKAEKAKEEKAKAEKAKEKKKHKFKKGNIYEPEVDPDEIEGEFPSVENNKYYNGEQVVLQNLETRVLAYCRGTPKEIEFCVQKMECSGFTRITEVPYMSAKYDKLKQGEYPSRRWRNGESVPRW